LRRRRKGERRRAASRNQKILQKETKQTKTGEDFAKNAEFLEIALQGGVGPPVAVGDDQFGLGW
jgi:hypothetical protein